MRSIWYKRGMRTNKRLWVVLTVVEALPLFGAGSNGPFYSPGSQWYSFPGDRAFVEQQAVGPRVRGFTATVTVETL